MTMSATLQIVGSVIAGQPNTIVLTVANSGGSTVNVTGITPRCDPADRPVALSPIWAPPGTSVASATPGINQTLVPVLPSGTTVFTFSALMFSQGLQTGLPQQGALKAYLTADIVCDDGSEFSPINQVWSAAMPAPGEPGAIVGKGSLQFNVGFNSAFML